jgi:hypothetical protein
LFFDEGSKSEEVSNYESRMRKGAREVKASPQIKGTTGTIKIIVDYLIYIRSFGEKI